MPTLRDFPDVEAVVAEWLRLANITDLGTRVYSSVPKSPTFPLVTVQRVGGQPAVRQYLDAANIQVDVWGVSKSQARDIAAAARTACFQLEGTSVSDPVEAFVSAVEDSLGLTWLPDPETGRDRYVFSVVVYARSLTAAAASGGYGEGGYGL